MTTPVELLLELRTDPMPWQVVEPGVTRLKATLVTALRSAGLGPKQSAMGFTSRRLLVLFRGLSLPEGASGPGRERDSIHETVSRLVKGCVERMEWSESMVWSDHRSEGAAARRPQPAGWISPVRGVLLLLDGILVPVSVFGVDSGAWTVGPERVGRSQVAVEDAESYGRALVSLGVEVRFGERRRNLSEMLALAAQRAGGELVSDHDLLRERAVNCESLRVITISIDPKHRALPRELLQESVRERLSGFCVVAPEATRNGEQLTTALFVTESQVSPEPTTEVAATVRSTEASDAQDDTSMGYRWALETYLEDVRFFLERDRRRPLAECSRELDKQLQSPLLGTHGERAQRCEQLCTFLCLELDWGSEKDRACEAIRLLAADARTDLLRAFPDLEGVIGGLLAREEGYPASVWQAIADSKRPALDHRTMPRGRVGKLVALAHRLDACMSSLLVRGGLLDLDGMEGEGDDQHEPHKGPNSDPSGHLHVVESDLMESMVRIAVAGKLALDLRLAGAFALRQRSTLTGAAGAECLAELSRVLERAQLAVFESAGFDRREIMAIVRADGSSLVSDQVERLEGLRSLRGDQRVIDLAQSSRRIESILQGSSEQQLDVALLAAGSERELYFSYRRLFDQISGARSAGSYSVWLQHMVELNDAVDRFLREILIRDEVESLRQNRLALLQRVYWLYSGEIRMAELLGDD